MRRVSLLALLVVAFASARARVAAQQPNLASVAGGVAGAWSAKDADGLARLLSAKGVALYLFDESHPAAGVRQARAALADVLTRGGRAQVSKVEDLGGDPRKGMAELGWEVSGAGSPSAVRYTIFLGFVLEDGAWKVSEIRVLR